jgi:hypothetical protein
VLYIILWILIPEAVTTTQKLEKKGVIVGQGYNHKKLASEYKKERIKEGFERAGKKIEKAFEEYNND